MRINGYKQQHKGTTFSLCSKPSMINDVHVPANLLNNKKKAPPLHSSSGRCSDDPSLSPKVGCMGQVKKKNLQQQQQNYKLGMVFPTTTTSSTTTSTNYLNNDSTAAVGFGHSNFSYTKLLRLFSSKTLLTTPSLLSAATKTKTTTTTSCSTRKSSHLHHNHQNRLRSRSCEDGAIGFGSPINVADLDPPLPVIIKKRTTSAALVDQVSDGDNNNSMKSNSLWKRRSGGTALKSLQIQQVHIPIIQPSISI